MNENVKSIFFVLTLMTILFAVSAVSATDLTDDTQLADTTQSNIVSDVSQAPVDNAVVKEEVSVTSTDNYVETNTKNIETKQDKNIKKSTKTVEVHDFDEFKTAMNDAVNDNDNDEYVINLETGTYTVTNTVFNKGTSSVNIIINGNNHTLNGNGRNTLNFTNDCTVTLNNITIYVNSIFGHTNLIINNSYINSQSLQNYNNTTIINSRGSDTIQLYSMDGLLTVKNSSMARLSTQKNGSMYVENSVITGNMIGNSAVNGTMTINNCTFNNSYTDISNSGSGATLIINNTLINKMIDNYSNLIIGNSTIDARIRNRYDYSNLTIDDNTILTDNCVITPNGQVIIDDINRILPYYDTYNGNYVLENVTISSSKTNNGNLTIKDSVINNYLYDYNANLTLINCTINSGVYGDAKSTVIFDDDCVFMDNAAVSWNGIVVINDTNRITPYLLTYDGNYTVENTTINRAKTNKGILYINNSTINAKITNNNLLFIDCSNTTGTSQLLNYNNMQVNNSIINSSKFTTNGTLNISNSVINSNITNTGDITLTNSTVNATIDNSGVLVIDDDTIFAANTRIVGDGSIIISDISKISPYIETYRGNYIIKDTTITGSKYNYGNLSVINSTITGSGITNYNNANLSGDDSIFNAPVNNRGTFIINNSTLNSSISNSGTIIIDDKTSVSDGFSFTGTGLVYTNNTEVINKLKENNILIGENVIEDAMVDYTIINNGRLTLKNSTINSTITNNGVLIIDDDCVIGERCSITGNGEVVISDITKLLPYITVINGTYTIDNVNLTKSYTFGGNITLNNCTVSGWSSFNNYDFLYINNSTINLDVTWWNWLNNYGVVVIDDNTEILQGNMQNSGDIFIGQSPESINPPRLIGDNIIENMIFNAKSTNYGNTVLINCTITKQITNRGNLQLINCTLSNNDITVDGSKTDGFVINNLDTLILDGCIVENNTFNTTNPTSSITLYGAIVNNGLLTVKDTTFKNNSLGYSIITDQDEEYSYDNGISSGQGSCIYNTKDGVLNIYDSIFNDNYAGYTGGAIASNGNMTINNTLFDNNTAGCDGGAISVISLKTASSFYNTSVSISYSNFTNNQVYMTKNNGNINSTGGAIQLNNQGESISDDTRLSTAVISNCILENNSINKAPGVNSYTGIVGEGIFSTFNTTIKESVLANAGSVISKNITDSTINNTNISTKYFTGNNIYSSKITVLQNAWGTRINNNTFTNGSALYIDTKSEQKFVSPKLENDYSINIYDNTFLDNKVNRSMQSESILSDMFYLTEDMLNEYNNTFINTTLNDNLSVNLPINIYEGESFTITGTYNLNKLRYTESSTGKQVTANFTLYDNDILEKNKFNIYINGVLNQTVDTLEFTLTTNQRELTLTVQPTVSQTKYTKILRTILLNDLIITPENYDTYIEDGEFQTAIDDNTLIIFNGTFTDKGIIYVNSPNVVIDGENATFTNTQFQLESNNMTIRNMKINNTQTEYPIINTGDNNLIINNNISITNNDGKTAAIYNSASNTLITDNVIYVDGPAETIDYDLGYGIANTQAILLVGRNNNTVRSNNITVTSSKASTIYGTIEGITNNIGATNTLIENNNINVSGGRFNYGINSLSNLENVTINENRIYVTGYRYTDGIQVGNNATNILIKSNNITCICQNTTPVDEEAITYGIVTTNMGSGIANNITITENKINIRGSVNYGIEVYQTNNTNISKNNITVNGPQSMGIGYAHSPNSIVRENIIETSGDSTVALKTVTEEIQQANVGIQIQQDSDNILIEDNIIKTWDAGKKDVTINTTTLNNTIQNNILLSSTEYGQNTVTTNQTDTTITNNTISTYVVLNPITGVMNTKTTLKASISFVDEYLVYDQINNGKVIFTDEDGNIIAQANVINSQAITNTTFNKIINSTITATYIADNTDLENSANTTTLIIKDSIKTYINLYPHNDHVPGISSDLSGYGGHNKTIITYIYDENDNPVTTGKVVMKIDGKTIKDDNGKVIYLKPDATGMLILTYLLPESWANINSTQTKTLEVIYYGTKIYSSVRNTTTLNILPPTQTTLQTSSITTTAGSKIVLTANITRNPQITTGKIVFKINGKTVKDANGKVIYAKLVNGTVSVEYTLPENMKTGSYNLTAVYISSYARIEETKTLTIKES